MKILILLISLMLFMGCETPSKESLEKSIDELSKNNANIAGVFEIPSTGGGKSQRTFGLDSSYVRSNYDSDNNLLNATYGHYKIGDKEKYSTIIITIDSQKTYDTLFRKMKTITSNKPIFKLYYTNFTQNKIQFFQPDDLENGPTNWENWVQIF